MMGLISDFHQTMAQDSAIKFIEWVAEEEKVTFQEAQYLCETDPHYSLGLKLSNPVVRQALNKGSSIKRATARRQIAEQLTPEELDLFLKMDMDEQTKTFKTELKTKKREAKKEKRDRKTHPDR